jgi:hypothetical protein
VLVDQQRGAPPQIAALDGSESLVTLTIGGDDFGYVPLLMAASLLDRDTRDRALAEVFDSLCAIGAALRQRAAGARVFFVDYAPASGRCPQTMLPPAGAPAPPLSEAEADLGRHVAATLERLTADAAAATGCQVVHAAAAGRNHHAFSAEPWTTTPARYGVPLPGRPAPLHPNGAGMRAVAELVLAQL